MTNRKKLIIFTRYPEPGTTKTRMIGMLGAKGAAELHRRMAERAVGAARALRASTGIAIEIRFAGGDESKMRQWLGNDMAYAGQIGPDLGERMNHAFKAGFDQGCDRIVLVGSDCPELTADILEKAFMALDSHSVVLGPAADGGYYLVGLNQRLSDIFQNIPWGSANVLEETYKVLTTLDVPCALLERLSDVDTPEDLHVWERAQKAKYSHINSLSIIIPALNESAQIQAAVQSARKGLPLEVIVVDGGSRDETVQVASGAGATVIQAPRGRAVQMNAGAEISRGSYLLFLHADTRLPDGYSGCIRGMLNDSAVAGGAFGFGIDQPFSGRGLIEWMTNLRARHFQMPYGDQAIFIRRRDFIEMGGYKPLPIMEDYDFIQRLKRKGRIVIADAVATTSGRRWLELGALRTTLFNQLVIAGYHCGVAPENLAAFYRNKKRGGFFREVSQGSRSERRKGSCHPPAGKTG